MRDPCMVSLDRKYYGDFRWNGYFYWVIEPCEHVIDVEGFIDPDYLFVRGSKPIIDHQFIPASITVIPREGEAIIIEHDRKMHGFTQLKSTLEVMDTKEGRAAVERRRLVPHSPAQN
jgi:hypothetical protein